MAWSRVAAVSSGETVVQIGLRGTHAGRRRSTQVSVNSPGVPLELPNQHDAGEEQQAEIEHSIESNRLSTRTSTRRYSRQAGIIVRTGRRWLIAGLGHWRLCKRCLEWKYSTFYQTR